VNRRLLALVLLTGVGQAAYTLGWLIAGTFQHGYSARDNWTSDLGARTASHPWVMNVAFLLFAASFVTAGVVLARSLPPSPARRVAASWFGAVGIVFAPVAFLREDCWSVTEQACWAQQQAGTLSWQHYAHLNLSIVFGLFVSLTPLMLWFALPPGAVRKACGVCAAIGVAGLLAAAMVVKPTPPATAEGDGLVERLQALIINGWVLVVMAGCVLAGRRSSGRERELDERGDTL
jgi:hypothetical membrane protein